MVRRTLIQALMLAIWIESAASESEAVRYPNKKTRREKSGELCEPVYVFTSLQIIGHAL